MMSAIFSATPAFLTKVARAPPIPVTTIGTAEATIPSFTQSFKTSLLLHFFPVNGKERIHPVNRAANGLPMKARKFAIGVSGTRIEATVLRRIKNSGNRIGSRDLNSDGSSMFSLSAADFRNSSFGATGVFKVIQYNVAAITLGTATIAPQRIACPRGTFKRAAADTGPGVGGTKEAVTRAPR